MTISHQSSPFRERLTKANFVVVSEDARAPVLTEATRNRFSVSQCEQLRAWCGKLWEVAEQRSMRKKRIFCFVYDLRICGVLTLEWTGLMWFRMQASVESYKVGHGFENVSSAVNQLRNQKQLPKPK